MATPPSVRQIARDTLGDVPGWFERVLQPLNGFMQQVTDSISGNLTVAQNLGQAWHSVTVTEGQTLAPFVVSGLRGKVPFGITVEQFTVDSGAVTTVPSVAWQRASVVGANGAQVPAVQITSVYGLDTAARVTLKLLVKAE